MNKKILLGAAISIASLQASAIPFSPTDARAMAMGGTGVSSAEVASTMQYNPALLATTREDDHFGLKFPQLGGSLADEDDFIDEVEDFDEESEAATPGSGDTNIDLLSDVLDQATDTNTGLPKVVDLMADVAGTLGDSSLTPAELAALETANTELQSTVNGLRGSVISTDDDPNTPADSQLVQYSNLVADDLNDLNQKALRLNVGGAIGAAIPSKKFSLGVSLSGQGVFSGKINVPPEDTNILRAYPEATDQYLTRVVAAQVSLSQLITLQNSGTATPQEISDAIDDLNAKQSEVSGFNYTDTDGNVIFQNGELAEGAGDAQLGSTVHMIGAGIADVGLTASRVFNIGGKDIAIGITPKLQLVTVFDYIFELDGEDENGNEVDFDEDSIRDNTEEYSTFNIDLGAAHQFGSENQWQAGVVIKNLIGKEFDSANGETIKISPMVRAGVSHRTNWTKVALDLDLTENDPVAFESATQYAAIGAEFNVFRLLQLRAGYRMNLAESGQDVVTAGFGFSPFAVHMDLGVMANTSDPEKEAGIAFEFGVEF